MNRPNRDDAERIRAVLIRMLRSGPLQNFPQRQTDLEILLALAACRFSSTRSYTETEVRDRLDAWLNRFATPEGLDHVTLRRTLVEAGFLARDPSGTTYTVDHAPAEDILPESVRNLDPGDVLESLRAERERRKQSWVRAQD